MYKRCRRSIRRCTSIDSHASPHLARIYLFSFSFAPSHTFPVCSLFNRYIQSLRCLKIQYRFVFNAVRRGTDGMRFKGKLLFQLSCTGRPRKSPPNSSNMATVQLTLKFGREEEPWTKPEKGTPFQEGNKVDFILPFGKMTVLYLPRSLQKKGSSYDCID